MDPQWQQKEAVSAAEVKLEEAAKLTKEAAEILRSVGLMSRALDADEAVVYIYGAAGADYD